MAIFDESQSLGVLPIKSVACSKLNGLAGAAGATFNKVVIAYAVIAWPVEVKRHIEFSYVRLLAAPPVIAMLQSSIRFMLNRRGVRDFRADDLCLTNRGRHRLFMCPTLRQESNLWLVPY